MRFKIETPKRNIMEAIETSDVLEQKLDEYLINDNLFLDWVQEVVELRKKLWYNTGLPIEIVEMIDQLTNFALEVMNAKLLVNSMAQKFKGVLPKTI